MRDILKKLDVTDRVRSRLPGVRQLDVHPVHAAEYVLVFGFCSVVLPLVYIRFPLQLDESLFLVLGEEIQAGSTLYTDVADHKPPALPWLAAVLSGVSPEPYQTARILTAVVNAATALIVGGIGARLRSIRTGAFASLIYLVSVYLPHFQGYHFQTEPFANLFLALGALALLSDRPGYRVVGGCSVAVAGLFNQSALLIGLPILVYVVVRWRRSNGQNLLTLGVTLAAIGVGFLSVLLVTGGVLFIRGSLSEAVLYTVYYPITGYSRSWSLSGQLVGFAMYLPVWVLVGAELRRLGAMRWREETPDAGSLFVAVWVVVLSYPGFTGFSGGDRLLFAFPPAAILAAMTLSRVYDAVFPLTDDSSGAPSNAVPQVTPQWVTEFLVVVFVGLLVVSAGVTAVNLSAKRTATVDGQAATATEIGERIEGDTYLLTYENHIFYHARGIEPPQTFLGYPYSEKISRRVVRDIEQQEVEYVVVPIEWVSSDGTVEKRGLWTEQRAVIFEFVNEQYEPHYTFDEYVAFRRR